MRKLASLWLVVLLGMMSPMLLAGAGAPETESGTSAVSLYGIGSTDTVDSYWLTHFSERVGVKVNFIIPPAGSDSSAFYNTMIASGDYPDIIFSRNIPAETYLKDGVILDLTKLMPKYAPNYYKYVNADVEINRSVKTDKGQYYGFFHIREGGMYRAWWGQSIRADLLQAEGLAIPVTLADWEKMLKVFYEKHKLVMTGMADFDKPLPFSNTFNTTSRFYRDDDDTVKLGAVSENYKQYLTKMKEWWDLGYIDRDLASMNWGTIPTKVLNSKVGAIVFAGGNLESYNLTLKDAGRPDRWVGVPYPVAKAGDKVKFAYNGLPVEPEVAVISTKCKDVPAAMKVCDFGYSPKGILYWNFGDEGVSYDIVNGKPKYKDFITGSLNSMSEASKYVGAMGYCIGIHAAGLVEQTQPGAALDAFNAFAKGNVADRYMIPMVTPTYEENQQTATIETAIRTYVVEMFFKFMMGQESLNNFPQYVKRIEDMGLQTVLKVKTDQVKRYVKR